MFIKKKGDISMQTVVMLIIGLAVLVVVLGIFGFQTKKGSDKLNNIGDSATSTGDLCVSENGVEYKCYSSCSSGWVEETGKKCLMPDTVCCKKI